MMRLSRPSLALSLLLTLASLVSPQETSGEWVDLGHQLRDRGSWREALTAYEQASDLNGERLDSRLWEIRCWMELNRINDALDAIDALAAEGKKGPEIDYLYGMAFARKAEDYIRSGVADSSIAMHFGDAITQLGKAVEADSERFGDAYLHLANAAYNSQKNEVARTAAEAALARDPDSLDTHMLLGRIALSQFVVASGDGSAAEVADAHWSAARDAFQAGARELGTPEDVGEETRLAQFHVQLGNALAWKPEELDAAAQAYGNAMAWDPTAVNYAQVWNVVGQERFLEVAAEADARFVERAGEKDARDATLLWYLGQAQFQSEAWDAAEEAFTQAVTKWPAYADSWFYIGRARYARGEFAGAIEAFKKHWQAAPQGLVATVQADPLHLQIVEWLVGQAAGEGNNLDAAFLSEVCAEAAQTEPRYWNNLGLFLRDEGERMLREDKEKDADVRAELFERSYAAYSRALALTPDDPALLNDTALMLHYHLDRDLDRAADMYRRAAASASELLATADLDEELRSLYEIALRDAKNNLALLEKERTKADSAEQG